MITPLGMKRSQTNHSKVSIKQLPTLHLTTNNYGHHPMEKGAPEFTTYLHVPPTVRVKADEPVEHSRP